MANDRHGSRASALLQFASSLLVTIWAGSLWTICLIAAPAAFATLPERHLAGMVVGRLFQVETWLGVVVAILLLAVLAARKHLSKAVLSIVLLTAVLPLISQLVVVPLMDQARAANDTAQFGRLHGVSAVLFLTACVSALALVWKVDKAH
jgi:Domain of unknown function (DUF4149)